MDPREPGPTGLPQTPIGVFRAVARPTFDALLNAQEAEIRAAKGPGDLDALLAGGETWQVA